MTLDPNFYQPPTQERDQVLGAYIDAWDRLEKIAQLTMWAFVKTEREIFEALMGFNREANRFREVMLALGKMRLSEDEFRCLDRLCTRYDRMARWRNRIVHGHWEAQFLLGDPIVTRWKRIYPSLDPDTRRTFHLHGVDAKVAANHVFDLARIRVLTLVIEKVIKAWSDFLPPIFARAFPEGPPSISGVPRFRFGDPTLYPTVRPPTNSEDELVPPEPSQAIAIAPLAPPKRARLPPAPLT